MLTFGTNHLIEWLCVGYEPCKVSTSVIRMTTPKNNPRSLEPLVFLSPPAPVLILSPISARFLSVGGSTVVRRCSHCASGSGGGSVIPKIDSYRTASPRATSSYLFSLFQVPGVNVSEDFELFT